MRDWYIRLRIGWNRYLAKCYIGLMDKAAMEGNRKLFFEYKYKRTACYERIGRLEEMR